MSSVNDLIQVRIRARFDGEPIMNNLGFQVVDAQPTFESQVAGLLGPLDATLAVVAGSGPWTTGLSAQYAIEAVEFVDVFPGTHPMISVASAAVGGVTTDDAMPPNDALCATLRSAFKGPGGRGRVYFTGFSEGSANGGYWEAGAQTYAQTILDILNSNFGEEGTQECRWTIIHRTSNGGVRGAPVVKLEVPESKPVMSYTVHNSVRSIGRRAVGRRIHRTRAVA